MVVTLDREQRERRIPSALAWCGDAESVEKLFDAVADLVTDEADGVEGLAGGVVEVPVLV